MDGPNQVQIYKSTKWTDPTKDQKRKSTKWTDLTKVELTSPQSERIPPRVKHVSPQSGRPLGVTTTFHGMNGPDQSRKYYEGPRRGRIKLSKY